MFIVLINQTSTQIVETLWSLCKSAYRKTLADDPLRERTEAEFEADVKKVCKEVAYKHN